jgi:hypothetical protein
LFPWPNIVGTIIFAIIVFFVISNAERNLNSGRRHIPF